jgi:hypothetical protein
VKWFPKADKRLTVAAVQLDANPTENNQEKWDNNGDVV